MSGLLTYSRRLAALAILAAAIASALWGAAEIAGVWRVTTETLAAKRALLGKLNAIASRSKDIAAALDAARNDPGRAWFLQGESAALVAAGLQQRLQQIASDNGAQFIRASEAEPRTIDAQDYRGVRIELSGSLESIQRSLFEIETGIPYLFIAPARIGADQAYAEGQPSAPLLETELDVYGAVLPAAIASGGQASVP